MSCTAAVLLQLVLLWSIGEDKRWDRADAYSVSSFTSKRRISGHKGSSVEFGRQGIAGMSAALSLGRSLRHVLVVDAQKPCNRNSKQSNNLLGFDGVAPSHIASTSRKNVEKYETVKFWDGAVVQQVRKKHNGNFAAKVSTKLQPYSSEPVIVSCRKVIIATGVTDVLPSSVTGLQECWGKSVIHCPYCHGYEYRHKATALWISSPTQLWQMVPIIRTMTEQLCVVGWNEYETTGMEGASWKQQLESRNITVYQEPVTEILHQDGCMTSLRLRDGEELPMDALYIRPLLQQNFPVQLEWGKETLSILLDDKRYVHVDAETQKTSVDGIMACGDCTTANRALSIAIASGTRAAKMLNYELCIDCEDWGGLI
ncbi:FAD-dependent pyridine nucleotide-disulfide oxidoreductase [Nitzschia inconspicua]|uniref:FAD-dependent pyridine nucleotide-disulfide oxidoreductase n=1 Tax=Nitzschia inconspicua TaxID=303405 RepID=A0A9K3M1G4_9STRA|nr:FAD-dependent pyridine nucleotide-disulfide oxidoreductase [Nitzschia inconspicua]